MVFKLKEIKELVEGELIGPEDLEIRGIAPIEEAGEGDLTFLTQKRYLPYLSSTRASAVIVDMNTPPNGKPIIRVKNPYEAVARLMQLWNKKEKKKGIHPTAIIDKDAVLGKNVYIGPGVVIEKGAKIGDETIISAQCYIGEEVEIGKRCYLHPRVTVEERVKIGNRVIIHSGAVIGSEGFGYYQVEGKSYHIPHLGRVIIEDDVEIGANTTIDRGTLSDTIIGEGTKIDNLVQIAHNVIIGKHCLIVAQVGISGSVKIGDHVVLAGQVGVCDHVKIGRGVKALARAVITKDIPEGLTVSGFPARDHKEELKIKACLSRLPEIIKNHKNHNK